MVHPLNRTVIGAHAVRCCGKAADHRRPQNGFGDTYLAAARSAAEPMPSRRLWATLVWNAILGGVQMNSVTPSLRSLDVKLEERSELLIAAARRLPGLSRDEREQLLRSVLGFLVDEVGEHLRTDHYILYPEIAERLGDPLAIAPMNYDHRAINWWIDEIAHADLADTDELQRLLYGVHALIKVHLSREEDLYVGAIESASWPAGC
jgi:hemerythrin HHE cation binding domain-containing protein